MSPGQPPEVGGKGASQSARKGRNGQCWDSPQLFRAQPLPSCWVMVLLVLFMPPHTYFLIWQCFRNVFMLDTVQWPCTNILLNSICIINTFSITFFSLDVQQYCIWNPWFVVFSSFLPWPISGCQYDSIGHGVGNSGTYIRLFYFRYTDPVAANNLKSIEKNKMYKHRKMRSFCFLRQVNVCIIDPK